MFYVVGLGNPGEEYENSRHNSGRMVVSRLSKDLNFPDWQIDKKSKSLISKGEIKKEEKVTLILPETFMNKSGSAVSYFIKAPTSTNIVAGKAKPKKAFGNLIIVYDDIDLPIGTLKISYNRGTGGHKGLDSVVKAIKTKEFVRIRVGVSPSTAKGLIKKPGENLSPQKAEKAVVNFILSRFKPKETEVIKKVFKKASEAIQTLITKGRDRAMNVFN